MKVGQPTNQKDQNRNKQTGFTTPVIGLERPVPKDHIRGHYKTLKLRAHPMDAGSPQFLFEMSYFSSGTPEEEFLLWQQGHRKVLEGQGLHTGSDMFATTRRMLEGDALATFNSALNHNNHETVHEFTRSMNALKRHIFPKRALQVQKCWMRRYLRKPKDKTIREFVARVHEINAWFTTYPVTDGDVNLPQGLTEDELLDLLENGIPSTWKKEMLKQGFDITEKSIQEFIEFCERLEICEATTPTSQNNNNKNESSPNKSQKGKKGKQSYKQKDQTSDDRSPKHKKVKNSFWCMQHGENASHTTNKCEYIKSQLKRLNGTYEAQHPSKTKEFKKKQELQMLIGDIADKAVKKVAKDNQKRRAKDDSSSEDEEYHNIKKLNNQLKKVNFIKMKTTLILNDKQVAKKIFSRYI
jgi:hypothetical protein